MSIDRKFDILIPKNTNVRIAFFAAPCAGKSFRTTQLSNNIRQNHTVGREFATDIIKKGQAHLLENQIWVSTNQSEREINSFNKNHILITDSPVELGIIYSPKDQLDEVRKIVDKTNKHYMSINVFINRDYTQPYEQEGRIHTDEESREIEKRLLETFKDKDFIFISRSTPIDELVDSINQEIERQYILKKDFAPTPEQSKPINFYKNIERAIEKYGKNFNTSISALAGCGKTSTLRGISNARRDLNFLYLVFSKEMQKESEKKFGNNVEIVTVNAFAFRNLSINSEPLSKYNPYRVQDFLGLSKVDMAEEALRDLERFFISSELKMDDTYSDAAKKLWDKIYNGEYAYTHSAYLKAFYVKLATDSDFRKKIEDKYDIILVDESQDLSRVAVNITQAINRPKTFVGDGNQNIFNFTGQNHNVLELDDFFKERFVLQETFRSSKNIVDLANTILEFSGSQHLMQTNVKEQEPKTIAYLSRTNSTILRKLYDMIKAQLPTDEYGETVDLAKVSTDDYYEILSGIRLPKIERPLNTLFDSVDTLNQLIRYAETGEEPTITDKKLEWLKYKIYEDQKEGKMKNGREFMSFCAKSDNIDVKSAWNLIVSSMGKDSIALWKLKKMLQVIKQKRQYFNDQFITTAHSSKGLEYDKVVILDDFPKIQKLSDEIFKLTDKQEKLPEKEKTKIYAEKSQKLDEEVRLFYVAVTRAKYALDDKSGNLEFFQEAMRLKNAEKKEIVEQDRIGQAQKYTQPTFSFDFGDSKVNV